MVFDTEKLKKLETLVNKTADYYELPGAETVDEFAKLTNRHWTAEEIHSYCCEYWSHHSLEETVYALLTGDYPNQERSDMCYWKENKKLDISDEDIWLSYRLGGYGSVNKKKITKNIQKINIEEILALFGQADGYEMRPDDNEEGKTLLFYVFECCEQGEYGFDYNFMLSIYNEQMIKVEYCNVDKEIQNQLHKIMEENGFRHHVPEP